MKTNQPPPVADESRTFSDKAWQQVRLQAQDVFSLPGKKSRAQLQVTVINGSAETLHPDSGQGVLLSFRLIGVEGPGIRFECARTPLSASVPPGGKHTQMITVAIPGKFRDEVTAIRVGLIQKGKYWVERINRRHPAVVRIVFGDGSQMSQAQRVVAQASQIWAQGHSNGLRWPHGSMMVSEQHKILYVPVAKCACTSLKSMMVELAGIERHEKAIALGVHFVTDRFNTGVQLKDKTMKRAWQILAADDYYKFSVIREPFQRLVSAYMEKFVYNRKNARNLLHTEAVIRQVQGGGDVDLQRGISFDEFVEYIVAREPMDLDPHWRPQHLYMAGVKHMTRIFRMEDLAELENTLRRDFGVTAQLAHKNKTRKASVLLDDVAQMTAESVEALGAFDHDSFLSSQYHAAVRQYFKEDFALCSQPPAQAAATAESQGTSE